MEHNTAEYWITFYRYILLLVYGYHFQANLGPASRILPYHPENQQELSGNYSYTPQVLPTIVYWQFFKDYYIEIIRKKYVTNLEKIAY